MNNEDDYNVKELIELKKKIDKSNHKRSEPAQKKWLNAEWREQM